MVEKKLKILITDDHKLVRRGVALMLNNQQEFPVKIDEAENGKEALLKITENRYDLVIMDISMPEITGIDVLKVLKKRIVKPPVIILSMHNEINYIKKAYLNGASAYLLKSVTLDELVTAIKILLEKRKYFNNEVANILFEDLLLANKNQTAYLQSEMLSKREVQIISLYSKGLNGEKIALLLNLSLRTVEGHRYHIFKKLKIKSISEMVAYGEDHGFI